VGRGTRLAEGKRDCLILDFVDVSALSLCTLPSLFGCPRDLDLRGEDARDAARAWAKIQIDYPALELEARALTLREIQDRAEAFNPLTLDVHHGVRAISGNAWFSLGQHGVGLHFTPSSNAISTATVVSRGARGKRWEVVIDQRIMERFSTLEDAVQAVDYEIDRLGRAASASARHEAAWRHAPPPPDLLSRLRDQDRVTTHAEALALLVWRTVTLR